MASDDQLSDEEFLERITPDDWGDIASAFGIPCPLVKAAFDPFEYAVGLRDGTSIYFESCAFDTNLRSQPAFVTLLGVGSSGIDAIGRYRYESSPMKFTFDRGIVVRVDHIVWAADAPFGS